MKVVKNRWRGMGLPAQEGLASEEISTSAHSAFTLFAACPRTMATPLSEHPDIASELGVAALHIKDERARMGLGSFKALGAAYAIAREADARVRAGKAERHETALTGETFACASAGNHGLSLAAGAPVFGAKAVVFIAETVPEAFAQRLRAKGADVVRAGATYEDSIAAAEKMSADNSWHFLPDGTWLGQTDAGKAVMEGYLVMGEEIANQIPQAPTHVFLQAGVGGLAAAGAISARANWGNEVTIIVIEPEAAPALQASIEAGGPVTTTGPVSNMGRLDCKEPSHLALKLLAREADWFVTISDADAASSIDWLAGKGLATTPSGGAGIAGLKCLATGSSDVGLAPASRILCYLSEGPEDG